MADSSTFATNSARLPASPSEGPMALNSALNAFNNPASCAADATRAPLTLEWPGHFLEPHICCCSCASEAPHGASRYADSPL